jgi:hypothetical protein
MRQAGKAVFGFLAVLVDQIAALVHRGFEGYRWLPFRLDHGAEASPTQCPKISSHLLNLCTLSIISSIFLFFTWGLCESKCLFIGVLRFFSLALMNMLRRFRHPTKLFLWVRLNTGVGRT